MPMHLYSVPIIQPDLRHEETIIQAANGLEYLQNVITEIFDRIDARIEKNNRKVAEINDRIRIAADQVRSLEGVNKAIQFYCPAKYPAADFPKTFERTFSYDNHKEIKLLTDYKVFSKHESPEHRNPGDKLQFFHVQTDNDTKRYPYRLFDEGTMLRGHLPGNITSIDSLLLFNKCEYAYGGATVRLAERKDKLSSVMTTSSFQQSMAGKIVPAPFSLTHRTNVSKKPNDHLFYTPGINVAPEIDVPFHLPDLPGIADDLSFNIPTELNIKPNDSPPEPIESTSKESVSPIPIPAKRHLESKPEVFDEKPISLETSVVNSPPPPPPPPPPISVIEPPMEVSKPSTSSDVPDAHNTLMEAIRQAGGKAKLKAANQKDMKSDPGKPKASPAGNLMADLHNKLAMRRKGISGAKDGMASGESVPGKPNVMDRLSALIPPPPKHPKDKDDGSENDEWD